ncbi:MAG: hypothetical protein DRJ64_07265 [Thermoprotei archaeon]|nr:MAG: hypothetical protein DRJ64_07265 [Thermoprotei archaeon]
MDFNNLFQNIPNLILMLPIIGTIIAFSRQVIGIKGFGIYIPLLLTLSFLNIGLKYGLLMFIIILLLGTGLRLLLKKPRLLYLPRIAIILTLITLVVFLILQINFLNKVYSKNILSVLIMIALLEKFISTQIERGRRGAFILTSETIGVSILCYYVANFKLLQNIVSNYPIYVILVILLINVFLGKWTGLRISEYFRFREAIRHIELPKKK